MDAWNFRETEFFFAHQRTGKWWLKTFFLAICIHAFIFSSSVFLPALLSKRPLLEDVVTVNLVSLPDLDQSSPPALKKIEQIETPPPTKSLAKDAVQIKPISIKPAKRKIQKAKDTRLEEEKQKKQQEDERKKELAKARAEEKKAMEAARKAREELANLIRTKNSMNSIKGSGRSSGQKQITSIVLRQYLSAVDEKLRRYWILPEMRKWDPKLEAIVVLFVQRDGQVTKTVLERSSNDQFYDQFVMKTIEDALPLPPFPDMMPQKNIELGIRFRPNDLIM